MKILVVDDKEENLFLARVVLESLSLIVVTETDACLALDLLRKDSFDMAIVDLQMPVCDGFSFLRAVREWNPTLPVVAMSATAPEKYKNRPESQAFSGYLEKPISRDKIISLLAERAR